MPAVSLSIIVSLRISVTCHYLMLSLSPPSVTSLPPVTFVTTFCHTLSLPPQANSTVVEVVPAPRWLHRFIIGRKGQNLREITENLPKLHLEFNVEKDAIFLEGPQAEVQQARSKLEDFTKDLVRGDGRKGERRRERERRRWEERGG